MGNSYLGEFEQLILLAIFRLGENAYGTAIRHELIQTAKRDASLGAIYTTLGRLEEKGLVESKLGEPTDERGGRAKKYYSVSAAGTTALYQSLNTVDLMRDGLIPALGIER